MAHKRSGARGIRYICAILPQGAIRRKGEGSSTFLPAESVKINAVRSVPETLSLRDMSFRQAEIVPDKTSSKKTKPKNAVSFFTITSTNIPVINGIYLSLNDMGMAIRAGE